VGVGLGGVGLGPNPPTPNPQSPIPNPQSPIPNLLENFIIDIVLLFNYINNIKYIIS